MKKFLILCLLLALIFILYVSMTNKNDGMSIRQKILKTVYPVLTSLNRITGSNTSVLTNEAGSKPVVSLYDINVTMNNGTLRSMSTFKGRKVLIVNTASDCGYTGQYEELQQLYQKYKGQIEILGFPANDFKEQEKGSDEDISSFCKINYGVTFPLVQKSVVVKGQAQNEVYQWLTNKEKNGWTSKSPSWNFSKYLVNEDGVLTHYFDPAVSPLSKEIELAIQTPANVQ